MDPPIDPRTGKPTDIWGGGTSLLADGRVLVTSDNLDEDPAHVSTGLNTVFTFDPWTESWQSHEPMRQGRWYPTQLLMPHGRTLIASGQSAPGDPDFGSLGPAGSRGMDDDAEVFEPGGDVSQLDFRSTSRSGRRSRRSTRGSFARIPGTSGCRPATDSSYLDPGRSSAWSEPPDLSRMRDWGTAVMLADGRVLTLCGGCRASPRTTRGSTSSATRSAASSRAENYPDAGHSFVCQYPAEFAAEVEASLTEP